MVIIMKYTVTCLLVFSFQVFAAPILFENQQFSLYTFDENQDMQSELLDTIQQAYDKFEFFFDIPAQAITVIAYPDGITMQNTDINNLKIKGKALPFLIKSKKSEQNSVYFLANLGIKVEKTNDGIEVKEILDPIVGLNGLSGIQVGDQLLALNNHDIWSVDDLIKQVGVLEVGSEFSLNVLSKGEQNNLQGKKLNLQTQTKLQDDNESKNEDSHLKMLGALQHEIGHFLLIRHMNEQPRNNHLGQKKDIKKRIYGSLKTPDWLDELVANMCESDLVKKLHKSTIKEVSDLMPLKTLLTTRHPSMDAILNSQAYKDKAIKGQGMQIITLSPDDLSETEKKQIFSKTGTFYGSSLLLGEYLYHQGGSHLLKSLIEQVRTNKNNDFSLIEMIQSYDSLGHTIEELESGFHRFVAQRLNLTIEG